MTEYITKKQAQDILCRGCNKDLHLICRCDKWAEIRKTDGIDIVHCKDCKHSRVDKMGWYCNKYYHRYVDENTHFCSDGEREEKRYD